MLLFGHEETSNDDKNRITKGGKKDEERIIHRPPTGLETPKI